MKIAHENDVQTNFFWNVLGTLNTRKFSGLKKKKKNSCHLFKRYSKCPQSVPNVYF